MKKIILFALVIFQIVSFQSHAQCTAPTGLRMISIDIASTKIAWDGPVDTFHVEYGPAGFMQGTGMVYNVIDTMISISGLTACHTYDVYVRRVCDTSYSPFDTIRFTAKDASLVLPTPNMYTFISSGNCADSLYTSSGKGFQSGSKYYNTPSHGASGFQDPSGQYGQFGNSTYYYYADGSGVADSSMVIATSWMAFDTNVTTAVFYFLSNNTTNPGDNVTLKVHAETNLGFSPNLYTFSGDHNNWKLGKINLSALYSAATTKVRLIFEIDQTTSLQPEYNDFLISHYGLSDSIGCPSVNQNFTVSKLSPTWFHINRSYNGMKRSTYQWGPLGFTPNNGQQIGQAVTFSQNQTTLANIPIGAKWIYYKDTCDPLTPFPAWQGPYDLDTTGAGTLIGQTFLDRDSNCVFSGNDLAVAGNNLILRVPGNSSSKVSVIPNNQGQYYTRLLKNSIQEIVYPSPPASIFQLQSCSPDTVLMNTSTQLQYNVDFALKPSSTPEISSKIRYYSTTGVQGYKDFIAFQFDNYGKDIIDTARITVRIHHWPGYPTMDSITFNGGTIISTSPLIYYKEYYNVINHIKDTIRFKNRIDTAALGYKTYIKITVDSLQNEQNIENNTSLYIIQSVSAVDPNDKHVSHPGEQTDTITQLSYHINFQNTGNYPANTVRVVDTLPSYFVNADFVLNETSHLAYTEIDENNVATFLFYNINLPDSTTDLEGSKGFINYTISLAQPMVIGDSIANRAHIFFDYQPAVITNYAWTKIVSPESCASADSISTANVACTQAEISWVSAPDILGSVIEFGPAGFSPGSGTKIIATSNPFTLTGLAPGQNYSYYVLDSCSEGLNLPAAPGIITTPPLPSSIFVDTMVLVTATFAQYNFDASASLNANTYTWFFGDGNSDTGKTTSHNYQQNGSFTASLIAENDCGQDSVSTNITVQHISIEDYVLKSIRIFPNPATSMLYFEGISNGKIEITLTDAAGKVVYKAIESSANHSISLENLAPGVYFILLKKGQNTLQKKIIKL